MAEDQNRTLSDKFMLRFPDGMRDRIKRAAEANNRSMNAEIISTLDDAYPEEASVESLMEYMKALADTYKDPEARSATVLREIYDVLDGIRSKLREEEDDEN